MVYVVYWEDKEGHIRTELCKDREEAINKVRDLASKYDRCGINCHESID